ncbi:hypothetical protein FUAX_02810 [Fulvitalea axinellae]|uniref:Thioredoxin family protein n=1 Tax=Fulvitalea axinellae TaxID=1182444 RepID=A0AAU9D0B4_9BACT|nr:hypothetical protein FUAX_02810 [Fulvitalea axinellae]
MKKFAIMVLSWICITTNHSSAQKWNTDFETAKAEATQQSLPILLVFQGSDWNAGSIKLEREVWSTPEFASYAKNHLVLLKADFPRRKRNALTKAQQKHNKFLAEQYNRNGYFPLVVVLDQNGTTIRKLGYKKVGVKKYIKLIEGGKL